MVAPLRHSPWLLGTASLLGSLLSTSKKPLQGAGLSLALNWGLLLVWSALWGTCQSWRTGSAAPRGGESPGWEVLVGARGPGSALAPAESGAGDQHREGMTSEPCPAPPAAAL